MDELPEQLDEIRARLGLEPFSGELHQALGKALYKAGDLNGAREAYERAIILDPADPWSYLYLGNLFYTLGDFDDALGQFGNAQRLVPDLAIAYVCMADAYHCLGEMALADKHYHKAVAVEPDDQCARENLKRWQEIKKGLTDR